MKTRDLLDVIARDYEETARQRRKTYGNGDCIAGVWDEAARKLRENKPNNQAQRPEK